MPSIVTKDIGIGTCEGQLFLVPGTTYEKPYYPVAWIGAEGRIVGHLFEANTKSRTFYDINNMELKVGYELVITEVTVGETCYKAMTYNWPYIEVGPPIPDNDWSKIDTNM